jgi:hypothetical protein
VFVSDCEEEKRGKKRSFVFFWIEAKKNECIRSSNIEDLPLLVAGFSANEYSCAHGAQINFGDLTPYLTYALYVPLMVNRRLSSKTVANKCTFHNLLMSDTNAGNDISLA